jgi:hypothetical protein
MKALIVFKEKNMNCEDLKHKIKYDDFYSGSLDSYILSVEDKSNFIKTMWQYFSPQDIHILFVKYEEDVNNAININDKAFSLFVILGRCYVDLMNRMADTETKSIYTINHLEQKMYEITNNVKEAAAHLNSISL